MQEKYKPIFDQLDQILKGLPEPAADQPVDGSPLTQGQYTELMQSFAAIAGIVEGIDGCLGDIGCDLSIHFAAMGAIATDLAQLTRMLKDIHNHIARIDSRLEKIITPDQPTPAKPTCWSKLVEVLKRGL